jgi:hypothetical protein
MWAGYLLAGLELGGVLPAVAASQVSRLPSVFVRKAAKTYGTCRLAEGGEVAGHRIAVIDDVVISGGQVIESCRELRDREADIAAVLRDRPRTSRTGQRSSTSSSPAAALARRRSSLNGDRKDAAPRTLTALDYGYMLSYGLFFAFAGFAGLVLWLRARRRQPSRAA